MSLILKTLWVVIGAAVSELLFIFVILPVLPEFLIIPPSDMGRGLGTLALGSLLFTAIGVAAGLTLPKHFRSQSAPERSSPKSLIKNFVIAIVLAVVLLGLTIAVLAILDKTGIYYF